MKDETADTIVQRFAEALAEALGEPPRLSRETGQGGTSYGQDILVEMRNDNAPPLLLVEVKSSLFPRDAREAIWRLRNHNAHGRHPGSPVPVVVATTISPGAREFLRAERVGYFDASGSMFIVAPGFYLRIEKPASRKQARSFNNLFAGRRAMALHAVWISKPDWFGVHEIAERAGVSSATASETLTALERREWVEARGAGPSKERRLTEPRALIDAWSSHQASLKPPAAKHYFVRATTTSKLQRRLDEVFEAAGLAYELTGISAGQIHSPFLSSASQVSCRAPAAREMRAVLEAMEARPVRDGWNLGILDAKSAADLRFRQRIDGLWVADPLQTYLDLLQSGGRAKELAMHLRAEKLEA